MNKYEKQVEQLQLNKEKQVLKDLKTMYRKALDGVNEIIVMLMSDPTSKSKAYQAKYQAALKKQIETLLDVLQNKEFDTINEFLKESYDNGYIGTMYVIKEQGIPLMLPISQEQVIKAIQLDSKISKGLYERLGEDVKELKKKIRSEVSRGISTSMSYTDISRNIDNVSNVGINNAMRIARTESHRIKSAASYDAALEAKKKGADIVLQWDATLDGKTRKRHKQLDGEIRELGETFSNGLRYPGDENGAAAEVINCRCVVLTRARWGLDEDELKELERRAKYFELDKTKDFEDYKRKYLKISKSINAPQINNPKVQVASEEFEKILLKSNGVESHVNNMRMYQEFTEYRQNDIMEIAFMYSEDDDVIYYNPNAEYFNLYDLSYVQAHELTHRMDLREYEAFNNEKFSKAVDICRQKVISNADEIQEWFNKGGKYEDDFAFSDIISALSNNRIKVEVGHTDAYWSDRKNVLLEIFANISAIDVLGYESRHEEVIQEIYDTYMEIVK